MFLRIFIQDWQQVDLLSSMFALYLVPGKVPNMLDASFFPVHQVSWWTSKIPSTDVAGYGVYDFSALTNDHSHVCYHLAPTQETGGVP